MTNLSPSSDTPRRDPRVRGYVAPARIVWQSDSGIADALHVLADDDTTCRLSPGGAVLLDFGREWHGGVRLDVPKITPGRPARVRVRFGESVTEAMTTPNNDHAIHDHDIKVAWMGRTEVGQTGFRFVRIDNLDDAAVLDLRYVETVTLLHGDPWLGSFSCSDERLNHIWETGAHTVHLCMQDHVWDGAKRDRLVWIGDLHPETMVISALYGGHPIIPATLDYQRDRTPVTASGAGGAIGGGGWMNGISSYSLWWILIQRDWYRRGGDLAYLKEQRGYLVGLLDRLTRYLDPDTGGEKLDGFRFLEWPTSDDKAAVDAGLQALVALALQAAAELCGILGESGAQAKAAALAQKAATVRRANASKQATALMVLAGIEEPNVANEAVLSRDPYRGLSTFYGYYVLEARAKAGDHQGCLDLIRNYWGGMLDAGATTFWEGFDLDWVPESGRIDEITPPGKKDMHADHGGWCYVGLRHSLCHGWAAGPTAWLSEYVLGVSPASPGFAHARIEPHLGDLAWARGTVPTPHGVIEVSHERQADGTVKSHVSLPKGVARG